MNKGTGFIYSTPDPKDILAEDVIKFDNSLPDTYRLKYPTDILDQGSSSICVSCVMKDIIDFKNKSRGIVDSIKMDYIYNLKANKYVNGMMPREAFQIAKRMNKGNIYAKVGSLEVLKKSILINGPVLIALMVKSFNSDFWNGTGTYGGHAISVVGWTTDSLIIKNSWGTDFGDKGYTYLPFSNFNKILECWTLIG